MLAAAIPFIESYFGTLIGATAGVPLPIAVLAAVVGNVISMLIFVFLAERMLRRLPPRRVARR